MEFVWNFGDGTGDSAPSASQAISHTYATPGRFRITVTATDIGVGSVTETFIQNVYGTLSADRPRASSTILTTGTGGSLRVWNVNPDNDTTTVYDVTTQTKLGEIAVGDKPRSIAEAPGGDVWVVNKDGSSISVIDPGTLTISQTISLPAASQPHGLVFSPADGKAYLVLEATGQLLHLHNTTGAILNTLNLGRLPRHLAITPDGVSIYVSRFVSPPVPNEHTGNPSTTGGGGEVLLVDAATFSLSQTIILAQSTIPDFGGGARGVPNYLRAAAISPDGSAAWIPSKQDNIHRGMFRDSTALNHENTVRAIASRIDFANNLEDHVGRVDMDDGAVPSAAIYGPYGLHVFVALAGSREVAVLDAYATFELFRFDAGFAPQGLALSPDGSTLFVHNFLSRSVGSFDITELVENGFETITVIDEYSVVANETLSAQVLLGKQLFNDARDNRLANQDYISCAACHNNGGQDGRVWDLTGAGEGLRNTIDLRGRSGMAHGNLHWTGNFDEVQDFEVQIRDLGSGTGLISPGDPHPPLSTPNAGRSADLDALAAYVSSLGSFGDSPDRNSDGTLTAEGLLGLEVFRAKNCAQCHTGQEFTDSPQTLFHDVGTIKPSSGQRLGGNLTGLDTPTLRGLWHGAPYLHDGSAASISDAIQAHTSISVTSTELAQLEAYLRQIDDTEPAAQGPPVVNGDPVLAAIGDQTHTVGDSISLTLSATDPENDPLNFDATGLPDGLSLSGTTITGTPQAATTYTVTVTVTDGNGGSDDETFTWTINPAAGGSDEYEVTPDVIALYHFNDDYNDASSNGLNLSAAGGVQLSAANLSWMTQPSGKVARFTNAGDTLTVSIPDTLMTPQSNSPLTIEARIYPRAYKGWSIGNLPIVDLAQEWDNHFSLRDRKWGSNPFGPNLSANASQVLTAQEIESLLAPNQWHLLQISYDGSNGEITVRIDGTIAATATDFLTTSRTNDWLLTLGNFDGDIDEVVCAQQRNTRRIRAAPAGHDTPVGLVGRPCRHSERGLRGHGNVQRINFGFHLIGRADDERERLGTDRLGRQLPIHRAAAGRRRRYGEPPRQSRNRCRWQSEHGIEYDKRNLPGASRRRWRRIHRCPLRFRGQFQRFVREWLQPFRCGRNDPLRRSRAIHQCRGHADREHPGLRPFPDSQSIQRRSPYLPPEPTRAGELGICTSSP